MNQKTLKSICTPECGGANRQAQVQEHVEILGCALQSLIDSVGDLCQRLRPVLRDPEPQCEWDGEDLVRPLVPLAQRISEAHDMAANANNIVMDLLRRLEV